MTIKTIILAAGQGTRMRSAKPKVLHKIAEKSLLEHVCAMSSQLTDNQTVVVYGHGGEQVLTALAHLDLNWVEQVEQLGTGHAVQQAVTYIDDDDTVLILYGDVPLLKLATVEKLLADVKSDVLSLLTVTLDNPFGYGRIIRGAQNKVTRIVEQKDANDIEQLINEGNTGILAVNGGCLKNWLNNLQSNNAQQEYYLTDVIEMAVADGVSIATSQPTEVSEVLGINNRQQLSELERVYQYQQAERLMESGVTLRDPKRFDLRGTLTTGEDVEIDINVIFEGNNILGNNVVIGANCLLRDAVIADNVEILANSIIDNARVGAGSRIGPFARLRPQAELADNVHIGNFVEIKKSQIASGSKVNHLSYIGDAIIGSGVNIGAGTITCNYDGVNKFQTIIEDGAFIGSDTQLIAPVTVGKNATIGAGSTITKNTPENQLTLTRSKQLSIAAWQRPLKKEE